MQIQVTDLHPGTLIITVATPRNPEVPASLFTAASVHEEYCARVRALLREYKHVGEPSLLYPSARRLSTYLPAVGSDQIYALRALVPAGTIREIDPDFHLEIMRIRYDFILADLPALYAADELVAEARERAMEKAVHDLFKAAGVPDIFIPGDDETRPDRTDIDILCEFGPSTGRRAFNIATPSA